MIIPIKEEADVVEKIKRTYTPDFIYRSSERSWRFTANDGEFSVWIKISSGFLVIAIVETEYDFFLKDGALVGLASDPEETSTADILVFFGWEDLENIGGM